MLKATPLLLALSAAGLAGCSLATDPPATSVGAAYVRDRLGGEIPALPGGEATQAFGTCRASSGAELQCTGTLVGRQTQLLLASQRWLVRVKGGRVLRGQPLEAVQRVRRDARRSAASLLAFERQPVRVVVQPGPPTYLCAQDAQGRIRFGGITTRRHRFTSHRLRFNVGNRATRLLVDGGLIKVPPVPYGLKLVGHELRYIAKGRLPCL